MFIAQCAVAAAVSYAIARYVFDVLVPLFAPVAAMLTLGMSYGQRLHRALEVTVGVAVGAFVGEGFVRLVGIGPWQVALIVVVAMSGAALLGAGNLMVTQAGVQASVVALLAGSTYGGTHAAFGRWFEALIGSMVALLMAAVVPRSALRRPRRQAATILDTIGELLARAATALRTDDLPGAEQALDDARATDYALSVLRGYNEDSLELIRYTPWHRSRRTEAQAVAVVLEPLDRAIRNTRVLLRRTTISLQTGERVPGTYLEALEEVADVSYELALRLADQPDPGDEAARMTRIARSMQHAVPDAGLSAEVIRAQVQSLLVDYRIMLGESTPVAQEAVRHPPPVEQPAVDPLVLPRPVAEAAEGDQPSAKEQPVEQPPADQHPVR